MTDDTLPMALTASQPHIVVMQEPSSLSTACGYLLVALIAILAIRSMKD